jgi:hypothetical protein
MEPREIARILTIYGKFGVDQAIEQAVKGDKSLLIMLLRSYRELGRNDRDCIADYLEGRFNRKRGRPRGIVLTEQRLKRMRAAAVVRIAKQSLKENKERYSHEKIVDRTVEMLSERGVRLTAGDIELEFKRPTRPVLNSRKK